MRRITNLLVLIVLVNTHLIADASDAEARTVANLDRPGIVPVHDVGSTLGMHPTGDSSTATAIFIVPILA